MYRKIKKHGKPMRGRKNFRRWELFPRHGVLHLYKSRAKECNAMDDLKFNPSALLIVGMLIGVVCTLLNTIP